MKEPTVHMSHFPKRLTFEVSVDECEILSLVQQVMEKSKELTILTNRLLDAIQVQE